jgi:chemotaxis protein MotB
VAQVRGFADQRLRTPKDPLEASNRRISIIVQYLSKEEGTDASAKDSESSATESGEQGSGAKPKSE